MNHSVSSLHEIISQRACPSVSRLVRTIRSGVEVHYRRGLDPKLRNSVIHTISTHPLAYLLEDRHCVVKVGITEEVLIPVLWFHFRPRPRNDIERRLECP